MTKQNERLSTTTARLVLFAMLAAMMIATQVTLFAIPGVQVTGVFIATATLVYRRRALILVYVYVMLYFLHFPTLWSVPYLYVWLPLWAMFMAAGRLPEKFKRAKIPLYMVLCGLHGLSFGLLYAPFQAAIMGWDANQTLTWVKFGLPFDFAHAVNNFAGGALILPLSALLKKLGTVQN
jgi:hypothetical protein